ncbi:MAG: hypothetical protein J2P48_02690 [Alphaproteobacteria bacterium]|nr:hypothetical protein [Alphaproteobacteria bacterium]
MSTEPLTDVINAGSSSLKFNIYQGKQRILVGRVDRFGVDASASAIGPNGETITPPDLSTKSPAAPSEALPAILQWARGRRMEALGHRIVHDGLQHSRPARVAPELLTEL